MPFLSFLKQQPVRKILLLLPAVAAASIEALAQTPAPAAPPAPATTVPAMQELQRVEVEGKSGTEAGRNADALSKYVVPRRDITQYGDRSLSEVLRRIPGIAVTNSANGPVVRLRGLGQGYTQVLVNGNPTPQNFTIDSISPDLIERIEVFRSPTAETGTQSLAGTINIILRRAVSKRTAEASAAIGTERGEPIFAVGLSLGDKGDKQSYMVVSAVERRKTHTTTDLEWGGASPSNEVDLLRAGQRDHRYTIDTLSVAPSVNLLLPSGDRMEANARLVHLQTRGAQREENRTSIGQELEYPLTILGFENPSTSLRTDLSWTHTFEDTASIKASLFVAFDRRSPTADMQGYDALGQYALQRLVAGLSTERSIGAKGKYSAPLSSTHDLSLGWDGASIRRSENRQQDDIFPQGEPSQHIDENYVARVSRLALYAQDEWRPGQALSGYAGLRWEGLRTESLGNVINPVRNSSTVLSPLLQALWKLAGTNSSRLRASLARTYKAPTTVDLMPRRLVAKNNTAVTPNYQGNPTLRPELAWGADVAFETEFENGASFSVSAYARRIEDAIRAELFQQDGVWIMHRINGGRATAAGAEIDGKTPLPWFGLSMKGTVTLNRSSVDQVPGPDNRLDQQIPASASIGVDRSLSTAPLTAGITLSYQRGVTFRTSPSFATQNSFQRSIDAYALWRFSPVASLRLSASNLLAAADRSRDMHSEGQQSLYLDAVERPRSRVRLTMEAKL